MIFTNALMAIPYALKVLENPMRDLTARYSVLCQSLGMQGFQRLRVVELPALKRRWRRRWPACSPLAILALWRCLAMTTFAPYRFICISKSALTAAGDGAVTALLLLLLCFALFTVIEKLPGRHAKTD